MLPVGIRNASITNARNTNASIKAVISHSAVFAISAALSRLSSFLLPSPSVFTLDIPFLGKYSQQPVKGNNFQNQQANIKPTIMPIGAYPVNRLFSVEPLSNHRKPRSFPESHELWVQE
jgi:hypothetical protein